MFVSRHRKEIEQVKVSTKLKVQGDLFFSFLSTFALVPASICTFFSLLPVFELQPLD
jgi:hypothetical protein